ncbi:MAG: hypothetical protein U0520_04365 [Candidatus Saccharimonadales bacterium]
MLNQDDLKNLTGWLQAIFKEVQESKGISNELRDKLNMLPEIRDFVSRERGGNSEIDRRIEDTKNHLEGKIDRLEQQIHDLRNILNDIKNKVDRLN